MHSNLRWHRAHPLDQLGASLRNDPHITSTLATAAPLCVHQLTAQQVRRRRSAALAAVLSPGPGAVMCALETLRRRSLGHGVAQQAAGRRQERPRDPGWSGCAPAAAAPLVDIQREYCSNEAHNMCFTQLAAVCIGRRCEASTECRCMEVAADTGLGMHPDITFGPIKISEPTSL